MSLRDQLLKKGLVSKSDVRRVNQSEKKARKKKQGSKQRKHALEKERKAAEAKARDAKQAARLAARAEASEQRTAYEEALRVRNLILGNRIQNRGDQPFWFKTPGGTIERLQVHRRIAEELTHGNLAIAMLDQGNRVDWVLIGRSAAEKLVEVQPEVVVHWAAQMDRDDGDGLLKRTWEPSLQAHRVKSS